MSVGKRDVAILALAALTYSGGANADFKVEANLLPASPAVKKEPQSVVPAPEKVVTTPVVVEEKPPEKKLVEKKLPVWVVKPGSRLRAVLEDFTNRAGWVLEINYKDEQTLEDKDLILGGGLHAEGDFKTAINAVFNSLPANAKIDAELWSDNNPPTLYVFRKGTAR